MQNSLSVSMVVIGDEILSGRTTDLNGSWLTKYLFKQGLTLKCLRFVRDNTEEMNQALEASIAESDIVITSGGIGPTLDDKTKNTLASFFQKKIVPRSDVVDVIKGNYERFGRSWTPETNHYHFFPEDFIAISNPKGLAPGLGFFSTENKLIMAAPGVPREFTEMVELEFYPLIKKYFSKRLMPNCQTVIRTQGIPEEKIFFDLCPNLWNELLTFGKVSSLPHTIGIDIVLSYHADENEFKKRDQQIKDHIKTTALASYVWQWGNKSVSELVFERAREKKCSFAFAESCTGGLTSSKITDLPGSSEVFLGSIISYDNSVKENILGVKRATLEKFGAVSIETATEMAIGVRELLKSDYAVSISGIAGPGGGSVEKPKGLVAIGYASESKSGAMLFQFPGDRIKLKDRFSDKALLTLLELME